MTIPEQIDAIKERYPDYWRNNEALKEAITAWDAEGHINNSGVFANYECEVVAKCGRTVAKVGIYKVRDGVYVHCSHFASAMSGFGYAPSVWESIPHPTAEQARQTAIAELQDRITDDVTGIAKADNEDRRQIKQQLHRLIEQPSLF